MKATLQNYRQSPRKVRLVADLVRGKTVDRALTELGFLNKRASLAVIKLINSAIASAKHNSHIGKENLFVDEIAVDQGRTLKRYRARARGRGMTIRKRSSHITIVLAKQEQSKMKEQKAKNKNKVSPKAIQ
ncbi:MAG: 50S ribosomal protein L22 [Patescibacteria group bacterium]|nr:MAG: 50S ribosomal protein L22 [Patescibacteria group bacterium]